jgi:hypothetical protein
MQLNITVIKMDFISLEEWAKNRTFRKLKNKLCLAGRMVALVH